ncbi:TonB-dependent receptor [Tsuneonella mangrovi]|uniref:TonB-dependent receptor n=1 Tax=Tsuneonella mangrovi TaxID=1982042 RepID=UPI000BA1D362|nr:TonB-dependent siderophore receptor [Tsuneonella mangrovi]
MHNLALRGALLCAAAAAPSMPAIAADAVAAADGPRDYLPSAILVTGQRVDGYAIDDGSTGTKTPTPLIDVPQTIDTITEDQLEDQAITQLGDALRYVPGVSLDTGEGHRDQVYIRGQASTADFYLDGIRDDAQYYRPLYDISRIEVLKGANALIFGRGGGGGVVNRVSKVADPARSMLGANASIDTFGAWTLSTDVNQPLGNGVAARINAAYEDFANDRDFVTGHFWGVSPTVTADFGSDTRLTLHYTHDENTRVTDRGNPSLGGEPLTGFDTTFFGSPDFNTSHTTADIARARIEHEFSSSLSANATVVYADYDLYYANVVPQGTDGTDVTLAGYTSGTKRQNLIGQANLVWTGETGAIGHILLAGVEAGRQDTDALHTGITFAGGATSVTIPLASVLAVPAVTVGAVDRSTFSRLETVSAYLQDQIAIGEHFQLIAGVRYDEFSLDSDNRLAAEQLSRKDRTWSPRFGVVVKPRQSLSLYASYATSFLPQSGDQFTRLDATTASLEPEKFENLEAGVKWAVNPSLLATAAAFRLDRSNTRAADPLNPGFTVLTGASRVNGFELSLAGKLAENWQANIGYTYLDGEIRSDTSSAAAGTRLQQVPRHQASAWTRYDLNERFGLGGGVIFQDKQFASISNAVTLPSWVRFDAAAYLHLREGVSLQLNVENLLGAHYYPSAHGDNNIQPGDPRSVKIGLRFDM